MIDSFRDTGKPLLSVLATPDSIFMHALAKFKHRALYANAINDRTAAFYTTAISRIDPFVDTDAIRVNHVKGYPNVLDPNVPVLPLEETEPPTLPKRFTRRSMKFLSNVPIYALMCTVLPIASVLYLINAGVQTVRSRKRIRLHAEGKSGVLFGGYNVPLLVRGVQHAVDDAFENAQGAQEPEYLTDEGKEAAGQGDRESQHLMKMISKRKSTTDSGGAEDQSSSSSLEKKDGQIPEFPTLALTPAQFEIIDALDAVGFRKYPAYITALHSHAAIIVRIQRRNLSEGKVVIKHWLEQEFQI